MAKSNTFSYVEKKLRGKTFGVLSTISPKGYSQSTGVLYGVSQRDEFCLYIFTSKSYRKTQNILHNTRISFVIPFPHHFFRFVPSSTVAFQGIAEIIPVNDKNAIASFGSHRILRMMINEENIKGDEVFIRVTPIGRLQVYGLGYSIMELRQGHTEGSYMVEIPR